MYGGASLNAYKAHMEVLLSRNAVSLQLRRLELRRDRRRRTSEFGKSSLEVCSRRVSPASLQLTVTTPEYACDPNTC